MITACLLVPAVTFILLSEPFSQEYTKYGGYGCPGCSFPQGVHGRPHVYPGGSVLPPDYLCSDCNVVLVTIDTLRMEHMGCYGYGFNTTPFLDELAAEGVLFTQAIASSPVTLPSHASILTSLYPFQHGVRDNGRYYMGESVVSLPEVLGDNGYATAAHVSSFVLDSQFGLDQGFDFYGDELTHPEGRIWMRKWFNHTNVENYERKADNVSDAAYRWVSLNSGRRLFLWVHYFDPHDKYDPPREYRRMFDSVTPEYDGEIRFVDDQLRAFFNRLESLGVMDDTIVVVVADHGEGLGDHGELRHGFHLYDTTVRVPLLVYNPRHAGGLRVDGLVETVDVAPTILTALGVGVPDCMWGDSLYGAPDSDGQRLAYSETYMRSRSNPDDYMMMIRASGYKFIYHPTGSDSYFNLGKDPFENVDLVEAGADTQERRQILFDFIAERSINLTHAERASLDGEAIDKLKALGYMI